MPEPSPSGIISLLWRLTLVLLAAALVLNFAVAVLQCAWPWIVGVGAVVAVVTFIIWRMRSRNDGW